jgi:hypothetical protein
MQQPWQVLLMVIFERVFDRLFLLGLVAFFNVLVQDGLGRESLVSKTLSNITMKVFRWVLD